MKDDGRVVAIDLFIPEKAGQVVGEVNGVPSIRPERVFRMTYESGRIDSKVVMPRIELNPTKIKKPNLKVE
jgi:hypothetical protein